MEWRANCELSHCAATRFGLYGGAAKLLSPSLGWPCSPDPRSRAVGAALAPAGRRSAATVGSVGFRPAFPEAAHQPSIASAVRLLDPRPQARILPCRKRTGEALTRGDRRGSRRRSEAIMIADSQAPTGNPLPPLRSKDDADSLTIVNVVIKSTFSRTSDRPDRIAPHVFLSIVSSPDTYINT